MSRCWKRLTPVQGRRVRALLGYDPATAGGLMSPDFACVYEQATRRGSPGPGAARASISSDSLAWMFAMNSRKRLTGAIALADLVKGRPVCSRR